MAPHEGLLAMAPYALLSVAALMTAMLFVVAVALRLRRWRCWRCGSGCWR